MCQHFSGHKDKLPFVVHWRQILFVKMKLFTVVKYFNVFKYILLNLVPGLIALMMDQPYFQGMKEAF